MSNKVEVKENKVNLAAIASVLFALMNDYQEKMKDGKITNKEAIQSVVNLKNELFKMFNIKNEEAISRIIDIAFNSVIQTLEVLGTADNKLI